jgi:hypothetical protein
MRALTAADSLSLWERGHQMHPIDQALLALSAALPEIPLEALRMWPIGERNRAIAELRCISFGSQFEAAIACPRCDVPLEFSMDGSAFKPGGSLRSEAIVVNGLAFRLPNSTDLAAAATASNVDCAVARLLDSCRLDSGHRTSVVEELSAEEMELVGEQMELADPMAEIRVDLTCSACEHHWHESLDIVAFLWTDLRASARRLLYDVHALASAYGWNEREILSLSDSRRQAYLQMVQGSFGL